MVAQRIEFVRQPPSADAAAYQRSVLDLFMARGASKARRQLLQSVACGYWRLHDRVQVMVPMDWSGDRQAAIWNVVKTVSYCLIGRSFQTYPRHRWTGADISVDQLGMAAPFHGILWPAHDDFVSSCGQKERATGGQQAGAEPANVTALGDGSVGQQPAGADESAAGAQQQPTSSHAIENAIQRQKALDFTAERPLGTLMAVRTVMEAWRRLLQNYLESSGSEWDRKQQAEEAVAMVDGEQAPLSKTRLQRFADQEYEEEFFSDLSKAWDPEGAVASVRPKCAI